MDSVQHADKRVVLSDFDSVTTLIHICIPYWNMEYLRKGVETMKHTKGPWKFEKETGTIRSAENYWVASMQANKWVASMDSIDGAVNNKANVALIAAAPELLECLILIQSNDKLMNALNTGTDRNKNVALKIMDAIAKAQGGAE